MIFCSNLVRDRKFTFSSGPLKKSLGTPGLKKRNEKSSFREQEFTLIRQSLKHFILCSMHSKAIVVPSSVFNDGDNLLSPPLTVETKQTAFLIDVCKWPLKNFSP